MRDNCQNMSNSFQNDDPAFPKHQMIYLGVKRTSPANPPQQHLAAPWNDRDKIRGVVGNVATWASHMVPHGPRRDGQGLEYCGLRTRKTPPTKTNRQCSLCAFRTSATDCNVLPFWQSCDSVQCWIHLPMWRAAVPGLFLHVYPSYKRRWNPI